VITDDDSTVNLSASPSSVQEDGTSNLLYTFTRSGNISDALIVNYTVSGTAAFNTDYSQIGGSIFSATSGSVTIAAGANTAVLSIDPTTDTAVELDETVALTLASGSYQIGATNAVSGTIINDDAIVSLAVSPSSIQEDGSENLAYTFTRTGATANPLTVHYSVGGSATLNTDYTQSGATTYTATTGTMTFGAGSMTGAITIDPTADSVAEPNETIGLTLAPGTGYTINTPNTMAGIIVDNDSIVALAVSPGSVTEDGTANLVYTFTRLGDATNQLTVNYAVGGTAAFGTDYSKTEADSHSATAGTVAFAAGSTTATVTISPTADTSIEPDETVALTLAAGSYKIGTTASVTGVIVNDDTTVSLSVSPNSVAEDGSTNLVYTFTRSEATSIPLTVSYDVGGTATFDTDYSQLGATTFGPTAGSVTFAVGSSTAAVTIDPSDDLIVDPNETVTLALTPGTGYAIGTAAAAVGTITSLPGQLIRTPIGATYPGSTHQEVRNGSAFAALKNDGSVVTWGDQANGGNSSSVANQLGNAVSQITSNYYAFAALKGDGSVITWGHSFYGGSSSSVASQLSSGVTRIASTGSAFAALKSNGSVVSWGNPNAGANSSSVASLLSSGVSKIFATEYAFAALKTDGSVVSWGNPSFGGNSTAVSGPLSSGVTQIFSNGYAFAALKSDGSVVTWGESRYGGNSSAVSSLLSSGVSQIFSTEIAFAALKSNGSVISWGDSRYGADSSSVTSRLASGVTQIFSSDGAFAALKSDGSVVTWGSIDFGGNSNAVSGLLSSGVSQVYASSGAFAALKTNGSVVTWGNTSFGGNSSGVASQLASGVTRIVSTLGAFAALKNDGSLVIWGNASYGGNNASVASLLTAGVRDVFTSEAAFAALKDDGSVVTWGPASGGGDSSAVATQLRSGVVSFADPFHDDRLVTPAVEPRITLVISPDTVREDGTANLFYTFARTGPTTSALAVNYTVGGTASLGTDYSGIAATPATKTVSFAAGAATATVTVDPTADAEIEPDETVALNLAAGSGYSIGTTAAVVGTILNDDIAIENQGNTALLRGGDGQACVKVGLTTKPITLFGSPASSGNASSAWQMLAAETIGTVNKVLWRYNSTGQVHVWDLDSSWNWTGTASGLVDTNSSAGWGLESSFQLDLNGDLFLGAPFIPAIESQGNTALVRGDDGQAYVKVGATTKPVTLFGSPASSGNASSAWQMLAAETIGTENKILWRYNPTGQVHVWDLDSSWNWTGTASGLVDTNSSTSWGLESSFQLDLNGDSIIGAPLTPMESQGNTSLLRHNSTGQPYVSVGSTIMPITVFGSPASSGNASSAWQMLAAETIGTENKILWHYNPSGQLHVWDLNSSWNWTGTASGLVDPNSSAGANLLAQFGVASI
jgi:alpha-tubulin suppressor-like RCC1 family protein